MKTKYLIITVAFILSSMLVNCKKNDINGMDVELAIDCYRVKNVMYPKDSKLTRVYKVGENNRREMVWMEYEYDNTGRISKVSHAPSNGEIEWKGFDLYQYNSEGKLGKISSYKQYLNNTPFIFKTVTYSYNTDGNMDKEATEWFTAELQLSPSSLIFYQPTSILYFYNDNQLMKSENYEKDLIKSCDVYEYENSNLVKKISFSEFEDDARIITEFRYEQNLLVYSVTYSEGVGTMGFMWDESRYYDFNNNLIRKIENTPSLSSTYPSSNFFCIWDYEYK